MMIKWKQRILSLVLAVVMVLGIFQALPAEAASDIDLTEVSFSYNKHKNVTGGTTPGPVYLNLVDYDKSIADAVYLPVDENSGCFLGETRLADAQGTAVGIQITSTGLLKLSNADSVGTTNANGDKLVVKGNFAYNGTTIVMPTLELVYDAANTETPWTVTKVTEEEKPAVEDASNYQFTVYDGLNNNANNFFVQSDTALTSADGKYVAVEDGSSGIWKNGTKLDANIRSYTNLEDQVRYCRIGTTDNVTEWLNGVVGDVLIVKGDFYRATNDATIRLPELKFTFDGTKWKVYQESATLDFREESFVIDETQNKTDAATSNTKVLFLIGPVTDKMTQQQWYEAADENSGIYTGRTVDEATKLDTAFKLNNGNGQYQIGKSSSAPLQAEEGMILIIKGDFYNTEDDLTVSMPEMVFQYTNGKWITYSGSSSEPVAEIDMTEYTFTMHTSNNKDRFFLNTTYHEEMGSGKPYSAKEDGTSGIWLNGEKTNARFYLYSDSTGLYRIGAEAGEYALNGKSGDILVVKGAFYNDDTGITVRLPEMKYRFNGTKWTEYEEVHVTYTDVKITGLHNGVLPSVNNDGNWGFYVMPNVDVTAFAEAWKDSFNRVQIQVGQNTVYVDLKVAFKQDGLRFVIPAEYLPERITENTAIVLKAGEYLMSSDYSKGIRLTQDFTIYANQYGFSTTGFMKEIVVKQSNAQLTLDRKTNYGGSESGLYLNTTDIFPTDKTWATRIRAVSYDDHSGIFYNGKKLGAATIARYADGKLYLSISQGGVKAKDKDVVTVKGLFALGELGVTYAEKNFYYNGKIWGETYTPAAPETYTKIQGVTINPVSKWNEARDNGNGGWDIYIDVNTLLPGEIDVTKFAGLTIEVNGQKIEDRTVNHSYQHTLFVMIAGKYVPEHAEDGIKITIKAGKALAGDKTTGIELTKDFTFYTFRGSFTELVPTKNTKWQEVTVNSLYRTETFQEAGKRWNFYLKLREELQTESGTQFYQLPVEINGKTCLVNISNSSGMILVKIPEKYLPGTTKTATIKIQAGAEAVGNGGRDGIRFKEAWEAYIFNGVISETKFEEVIRTETRIMGVQNVTESDTSYGVYLRVNKEIPGNEWYEYYNDFVYYYNGKPIQTHVVKAISANGKYIYFPIKKADIGTAKEGDIVLVKAGTEMNCGGYQIAITDEFMLVYSDGIWSQYKESDAVAPEAIDTIWEHMRFDSAYIPKTEDGTVQFSGVDEFNRISTIEKYKDYTMKFRLKKELMDEESSPFRVILRGTPVSETEPMTVTLLNGYVITFSPKKVTDKETGDVHYGGTIQLWKNGENTSLQDQYRLSYIDDKTEHAYFGGDAYFDYEISIFNVAEDCVCITIRVNDKLVMRYYDEAGSDPFDPVVNEGQFAIQAICPVSIEDETVELDAVISEADECVVGDKIRVAATYPAVIEGAEFTVDSKNAAVTDGLFTAEKPGTYTVNCVYNGRELDAKVITVKQAEGVEEADATTFPIIPVVVIAIVTVVAATAGTVYVIKNKKKKTVTEE